MTFTLGLAVGLAALVALLTFPSAARRAIDVIVRRGGRR